MRTGAMKRIKQVAIVATGLVAIELSACLPKNYFYNFAAAGQSEILNAFADSLFTSITDSLFPGADDDESTDDTASTTE